MAETDNSQLVEKVVTNWPDIGRMTKFLFITQYRLHANLMLHLYLLDFNLFNQISVMITYNLHSFKNMSAIMCAINLYFNQSLSWKIVGCK